MSFFREKIIFLVFGGYFDTKIPNFLKKLYLESPKKFLVNLFFEKTTYTYVKLCQEHAGNSGFSRKNRFWGQNGQNMQISTKFLKNGILEPPKNFLVNLFSLKTTFTYVKLCKENASDSGLPTKNRILGQNCQKYANFGKIFKNRILSP